MGRRGAYRRLVSSSFEADSTGVGDCVLASGNNSKLLIICSSAMANVSDASPLMV